MSVEMKRRGKHAITDDEEDLDIETVETETPTEHVKDEWETRVVIIARAVLAEVLCTTIFMFIVTATQIEYYRAQNQKGTEEIHNSAVGALAGMLITVGVIYSFADVSGAHFNPAVTFATVVTFKNSIIKGLLYMGAQLLGSVIAAIMISMLYPEGNQAVKSVAIRRATDITTGQAFFVEMCTTFVFVYVIFAVAFDTVESVKVKTGSGGETTIGRSLVIYTTSGQTKAGFAPIAIGCTLGACVFASDAVAGGGFNPARVFGFALVADVWDNPWMYWIPQLLGAAMAGYTQKIFSKPEHPPKINDVPTFLRWFCYLDEVPVVGWKDLLKTWVWG
eukprot:TRINITY_DN212_c0_g2_i1.p1 TRINITY_DN212_c0_g2~~TRINITY_DN212_c0_g2_i1.p1  ORF type:complete len:374 (-),score=80.33 TRINITY_DN212_c0_g2_i1:542-1543(-)